MGFHKTSFPVYFQEITPLSCHAEHVCQSEALLLFCHCCPLVHTYIIQIHCTQKKAKNRFPPFEIPRLTSETQQMCHCFQLRLLSVARVVNVLCRNHLNISTKGTIKKKKRVEFPFYLSIDLNTTWPWFQPEHWVLFNQGNFSWTSQYSKSSLDGGFKEQHKLPSGWNGSTAKVLGEIQLTHVGFSRSDSDWANVVSGLRLACPLRPLRGLLCTLDYTAPATRPLNGHCFVLTQISLGALSWRAHPVNVQSEGKRKEERWAERKYC